MNMNPVRDDKRYEGSAASARPTEAPGALPISNGMKRALYLTTTLPYVNADPHIGFALELVQADIYARYRALQGDDVFFNTGTDEHGLKIYRKALEEGKEPQLYVDEYAAKFRRLKEKLNLSPEIHFIRTTDPHHKAAAQEMWRRCEKAGDIYKKKYKGLYCVGDEAFIKESDLVNGKCPNHPTMDVTEIEEENYFFRLSAYQEKLLAYLQQDGVIVPEWRRQEAINFVQGGLEDFSISRDKSRMSWGIPVPDDDNQVMYVWFDALTNYISTLGWPRHAGAFSGGGTEDLFEKFWVHGDTLQLAGKDQVRFQSIMWQAMLMSAGLPTTKKIIYHGFITSGGQKMSKSIGNVIDPIELVDEYNRIEANGAEILRWFLARHTAWFGDSDVTVDMYKTAYNADLANGLGNLVSRVMKMASTHLTKSVTQREDLPHDSYHKGFREFDLHWCSGWVWDYITDADRRIQIEKPFSAIKTDPLQAIKSIEFLASRLLTISWLLKPFMPETAAEIEQCVMENRMPTKSLFPRKE